MAEHRGESLPWLSGDWTVAAQSWATGPAVTDATWHWLRR